MSARPNASRRSTAAAAATTKTSASIGSTSAPYYYYHQGGMAQTAQPYSYPYQYQTTATAEPYHPYSRPSGSPVNVRMMPSPSYNTAGTRAMYDSPYYAQQRTAATMAPYNNYNYGVGTTALSMEDLSFLNPISSGGATVAEMGKNALYTAGVCGAVGAGLSGVGSAYAYASARN